MSPETRPQVRPRASLRQGCLILAAAALLAAPGCKKRSASKPTVRSLSWQGLRIGMTQQQVRERVQPRGLIWNCAEARSLMFADGDGLFTRWVKLAARTRAKRCSARRKKGAPIGADRVVHLRMLFVDDKLAQLNVLLAMEDPALMKELKARMGAPTARTMTRHAYGNDRVAKMNVWALTQPGTLMLWIRMARKQELVFLTTDAKQIAAIRSMSTDQKGE